MNYKILIIVAVIIVGLMVAYFPLDNMLEDYYCKKSGGDKFDTFLNTCQYSVIINGTKMVISHNTIGQSPVNGIQ